MYGVSKVVIDYVLYSIKSRLFIGRWNWINIFLSLLYAQNKWFTIVTMSK
jgi:hypothetical protein